MTVVSILKCIDPHVGQLMSNNDPDAFIERMNAKAKELGMTNTVWNNLEAGRLSQPCKATIRSIIIQMMRPTRQLRVI